MVLRPLSCLPFSGECCRGTQHSFIVHHWRCHTRLGYPTGSIYVVLLLLLLLTANCDFFFVLSLMQRYKRSLNQREACKYYQICCYFIKHYTTSDYPFVHVECRNIYRWKWWHNGIVRVSICGMLNMHSVALAPFCIVGLISRIDFDISNCFLLLLKLILRAMIT